jgi:hypothetical protein
MNLQDRDVELNWREVTCKRAVNDDNFPRGIQDFDFSVSGKNAFIPSLSYFVIDTELTVRPTYQPAFTSDICIAPNDAGTAALPLETAAIVNKETSFRRPAVADGITLADHFGCTLYNNAFFRAGNSDVSLITQYIPQAGVLKSRLDKSNAWSRNIGRIVFQDDADFERRRNYVSIDGKFHDDGLEVEQYTGRKLYKQDGTVVSGAASIGTWEWNLGSGTLTYRFNSATMVDIMLSGIQVGDVVQILTADAGQPIRYYKLTGFSSPAAFAANLRTTNGAVIIFNAVPVRGSLPATINGIVNTTFFVYAPHDPACGSNITQVMFQPPIGIFSEANAISGGDFKISLNPSPNYKVNGVQSLRDLQPFISTQVPGDYDLVIRDVKFYVCTIKSDVSPTGTIPLTLIEMSVLNKTLNRNGGTQNLDFTVPPSTLAITVFVQGSNAGTTTTIPATKFYLQTDDGEINTPAAPSENLNGIYNALVDNIANKLQQIQVTYGSITKTQTLYNSNYSSQLGINQNIQRFLQSIQYSGKIVSEGGSENHPQYLERGNYWHFDFSKDKNDTSSYVNVQLGFKDAVIGTGNNLFIVAHYSRQCEIAYENGFITQVVSVNR